MTITPHPQVAARDSVTCSKARLFHSRSSRLLECGVKFLEMLIKTEGVGDVRDVDSDYVEPSGASVLNAECA